MKICIQYHERLGDVLRILPWAKYLHERGHEVFIECMDQYADILRCVTYAKHKKIGATAERFDIIYNRQVWPVLHAEYRKSRKSWEDFVFGESAPEAVGKRIVLDSVPEGPDLGSYSIVAPFGFSQIVKHDPVKVIHRAADMYGVEGLIVLRPPEVEVGRARSITCEKIYHMAHIIAKAKHFLGINSSPALIASAVRESYHLIPTGDRQDDYTLGATIVEL
jgi:hypothetical protein